MTPTEQALMPCPFCGGKPVMKHSGEGYYYSCSISCEDCDNANASGVNDLDASNSWNTRPTASLTEEQVNEKAAQATKNTMGEYDEQSYYNGYRHGMQDALASLKGGA